MMIKDIYENAIRQIENDRARNADIVRQNVIRETIAPFNAEIDAKLREALAALQDEHNQNVQQLQAEFEQKVRDMNEAANKRKQEFAEASISSALSSIDKEANDAICHLKKFIGEE